MSQYRSPYAESYLRAHAAGQAYERGITNNFELAIFELEKVYLNQIYASWLSDRGAFAYLDYATGTGGILALFADKTTVKFAVDSSHLQLECAKSKVPEATFIADNIATNPDCLPIRFELITCFRLLVNLEQENRLPVLQGLSNALKDDGILILDNHMNRHSVLGLIALRMKHWFGYRDKNAETFGQKRIINTISQTEMVQLANMASLMVKDVYRFMILPGYMKWTILPIRWLIKVERIMATVSWLNWLGKNQIFVCEKRISGIQ